MSRTGEILTHERGKGGGSARKEDRGGAVPNGGGKGEAKVEHCDARTSPNATEYSEMGG